MRRQFVYGRLFSLAIVIYIFHLMLRSFLPDYSGTVFRGYLGDLLALPVIIPIMTNFEIFLGVRGRSKIRINEIIFYFILFSLVFEWYVPVILQQGKSDLFDVIAYLIGGSLLYWGK